MASLQPAHEVIVNKITALCANLQMIEKAITEGGIETTTRLILPGELAKNRLQEIGGLCNLLEVIEKMVIPEEKLGDVIQALKQLTYRHAAVYVTIETLKKRHATNG